MYASILFPVDLEHDSSWAKALPAVKKLAETFGASVHVLYVVADVRMGMNTQFFPADYEKRLVATAKERLGAFIKAQMADMAKVDGYVECGSPYREIVETAERLDCDLIVMASHRPEMLDMLIGPNADNVVRHTKKSVMIVRD
jgi:universal stress protein F